MGRVSGSDFLKSKGQVRAAEPETPDPLVDSNATDAAPTIVSGADFLRAKSDPAPATLAVPVATPVPTPSPRKPAGSGTTIEGIRRKAKAEATTKGVVPDGIEPTRRGTDTMRASRSRLTGEALLPTLKPIPESATGLERTQLLAERRQTIRARAYFKLRSKAQDPDADLAALDKTAAQLSFPPVSKDAPDAGVLTLTQKIHDAISSPLSGGEATPEQDTAMRALMESDGFGAAVMSNPKMAVAGAIIEAHAKERDLTTDQLGVILLTEGVSLPGLLEQLTTGQSAEEVIRSGAQRGVPAFMTPDQRKLDERRQAIRERAETLVTGRDKDNLPIDEEELRSLREDRKRPLTPERLEKLEEDLRPQVRFLGGDENQYLIDSGGFFGADPLSDPLVPKPGEDAWDAAHKLFKLKAEGSKVVQNIPVYMTREQGGWEYVRDRAAEIVSDKGFSPGTPEYDDASREALVRSFQEMALARTLGVWQGPAMLPKDIIFHNPSDPLDPHEMTLWEAMAARIEVVGVRPVGNGDFEIILRQEHPVIDLADKLDVFASAFLGIAGGEAIPSALGTLTGTVDPNDVPESLMHQLGQDALSGIARHRYFMETAMAHPAAQGSDLKAGIAAAGGFLIDVFNPADVPAVIARSGRALGNLKKLGLNGGQTLKVSGNLYKAADLIRAADARVAAGAVEEGEALWKLAAVHESTTRGSHAQVMHAVDRVDTDIATTVAEDVADLTDIGLHSRLPGELGQSLIAAHPGARRKKFVKWDPDTGSVKGDIGPGDLYDTAGNYRRVSDIDEADILLAHADPEVLAKVAKRAERIATKAGLTDDEADLLQAWLKKPETLEKAGGDSKTFKAYRDQFIHSLDTLKPLAASKALEDALPAAQKADAMARRAVRNNVYKSLGGVTRLLRQTALDVPQAAVKARAQQNIRRAALLRAHALELVADQVRRTNGLQPRGSGAVRTALGLFGFSEMAEKSKVLSTLRTRSTSIDDLLKRIDPEATDLRIQQQRAEGLSSTPMHFGARRLMDEAVQSGLSLDEAQSVARIAEARARVWAAGKKGRKAEDWLANISIQKSDPSQVGAGALRQEPGVRPRLGSTRPPEFIDPTKVDRGPRFTRDPRGQLQKPPPDAHRLPRIWAKIAEGIKAQTQDDTITRRVANVTEALTENNRSLLLDSLRGMQTDVAFPPDLQQVVEDFHTLAKKAARSDDYSPQVKVKGHEQLAAPPDGLPWELSPLRDVTWKELEAVMEKAHTPFVQGELGQILSDAMELADVVGTPDVKSIREAIEITVDRLKRPGPDATEVNEVLRPFGLDFERDFFPVVTTRDVTQAVNDTPWLHGTPRGDIRLIDYTLEHSGSNAGSMLGHGLYLASDPETAIRYAGRAPGTTAENPALKVVDVNARNVLDIRGTAGELADRLRRLGLTDLADAAYTDPTAVARELEAALQARATLQPAVTDILKKVDLLGFDTAQEARAAIGHHIDWSQRWPVGNDELALDELKVLEDYADAWRRAADLNEQKTKLRYRNESAVSAWQHLLRESTQEQAQLDAENILSELMIAFGNIETQLRSAITPELLRGSPGWSHLVKLAGEDLVYRAFVHLAPSNWGKNHDSVSRKRFYADVDASPLNRGQLYDFVEAAIDTLLSPKYHVALAIEELLEAALESNRATDFAAARKMLDTDGRKFWPDTVDEAIQHIDTMMERSVPDVVKRLSDAKVDGVLHFGRRDGNVLVLFDPNASRLSDHKSITREGRVLPEQVLYQDGSTPKGAVAFAADGKAIIHAFEQADVSTHLHEVAHIIRRDLDKADMDLVVTWAKSNNIDVKHVKGSFIGDPDAVRQAEELFARGMERWLRDGEAPSASLRQVFAKINAWLKDIYRTVTGGDIDIDVPDEIQALYRRVLDEGDAPTAAANAQGRLLKQPLSSVPTPKKDPDEVANEAQKRLLNQPLSSTESPDGIARTAVPLPSMEATIADTMESMTKGPGFIRATARAATATLFGMDSKRALRHLPLPVRHIIDEGARMVREAYANSVRFSVSDDMDGFTRFLVGEDVRFTSGRVAVASGHDAATAVAERVGAAIAKLDDKIVGEGQHSVQSATILAADHLNRGGNMAELPNDVKALARQGFVHLSESNASSKFMHDVTRTLSPLVRGAQGSSQTTADTIKEMRVVSKLIAWAGVEGVTDARLLQATMLERTQHLMEELGGISGKSKIEGSGDAVKVTVGKRLPFKVGFLIAGHGHAYKAIDFWAGTDLLRTRQQGAAFSNWMFGATVTPEQRKMALDVAESLGVNADLVTLQKNSDTWLPRAARERLAAALGSVDEDFKALDLAERGHSLTLEMRSAGLLKYLKLMMTRGALFMRNRYYFMNTIDHASQMGAGAGLRLGAVSAVRTAWQNVAIMTPAIARLLDFSERAKGVPVNVAHMAKGGTSSLLGGPRQERRWVEKFRELLQEGGDKTASIMGQMLGVSKYNISVNKVMEGLDDVVIDARTGDAIGFIDAAGVESQMTHRDLREIAVRVGVFSSFDASELQQFLRNMDAKGSHSALRKATLDPLIEGHRALVEFTSEMAEAWSDRERLGAFVTLVESGMDPVLAGRLSVDVLFDYAGTMTPSERNLIFQVFFPFWAFSKNANRHTMNLLFSPEGTYRANVVRRAQEHGPELLTELLYDKVTSPYGVDTENMNADESANYWTLRSLVEHGWGAPEKWPEARRQRMEASHGPIDSWDPETLEFYTNGFGSVDDVPYDVRLALGMLFADQSQDIVDGRLMQLHPDLKRTPMFTRGKSPPRPERSAQRSYIRVLPTISITPEMRQEVSDYFAQTGMQRSIFEVVLPESTIQAGLRHVSALIATGSLIAQNVHPESANQAGMKNVPVFAPLLDIVDPSRAPILKDIVGVLDPDMGYPTRLSPGMAWGYETVFGVELIQIDQVVSPAADEDSLPMRKGFKMLPPGWWSMAHHNSPLGELNRTFLMQDFTPVEELTLGRSHGGDMLRAGLHQVLGVGTTTTDEQKTSRSEVATPFHRKMDQR